MKNNKIEQNFLNFFLKNPTIKPPFLLGFSGGRDSTILFHLLLKNGFPFQAVYIDHGWREESKNESAALADLCGAMHIPFHVRHIELEGTHNLEDRWRKQRIALFKGICTHEKLTGVILGHHADDQAETVLKRILEGAQLINLQGLSACRTVEGVAIYRPLLAVRKNAITSWLDAQGITYFNDKSNSDLKFLRSRMRMKVLPFLTEQFGKEIVMNLCRLSENVDELKAAVEELLAPYLAHIVKTPTSLELDVSRCLPQTPYIWKVLIKRLFEMMGISISNHIVQNIYYHVSHANNAQTLRVKSYSVCLQRHIIKIFTA